MKIPNRPSISVREVTTLAELARKAGLSHPTVRRRIEGSGVLPIAILRVGSRRIPLFVGDELEALSEQKPTEVIFDQTRAIQSQ